MAKEFTVTSDLYASQGQRFGNYIFDLIVHLVLMFAIEETLVLIFNQFEIYAVEDFFYNTNQLEDYLYGVFFTLIYYTTMEISLSRSVGKYITGTIVVLQDGTKPDAATILKRTLCRFIPFDGLSFLGSNARGWHDSLSHTYVVNKNDLEERMKQFYEFDQIGKDTETE